MRRLRGAVAQLVERRVRNAKVRGSIPLRSTTSFLTLHAGFCPRAGRATIPVRIHAPVAQLDRARPS